MAFTIKGAPHSPKPRLKRKKSGHTEPQSPTFPLDESGHKVRIAHFQWLMDCMSHSAFMAQRSKGRIPEPDGKDKNRPYWWSESVKLFLDGLVRGRWERTGRSTV